MLASASPDTDGSSVEADTVLRRAQLQALFASIEQAPYAHDFFAIARRIDALQFPAPRLGQAKRPRQESIRFGQDAQLDFAPAAIATFERLPNGVPRIGQRFFGLFGPMGPLPLHLTEFTRERQRHHADPTAARFADVFHHRLLLLFYRAWAQAQPTAHLDRPDGDGFSRWVGALIGIATPEFARRDHVRDNAKRFHAAALMRSARNAEGLTKIVSQYFRVPAQVEPFVGHWLTVRKEDRSRLGGGQSSANPCILGRTTVAGRKVWDRQYRLRLLLGPLSYAQYQTFLPGQASLLALRDWLHHYLGLAFHCEVRPVLRGSDVPALQLGRREAMRGRLGQTAWLGQRNPHHHRDDLHLQPERADASHLRVHEQTPAKTSSQSLLQEYAS